MRKEHEITDKFVYERAKACVQQERRVVRYHEAGVQNMPQNAIYLGKKLDKNNDVGQKVHKLHIGFEENTETGSKFKVDFVDVTHKQLMALLGK